MTRRPPAWPPRRIAAPSRTLRRGGAQSRRPRLWTTFPLATMSTPRSAQRRQACRQVEVVVERLQRVDGELQHRHVGVGVDVGQDRPGAVIDAPAVVVEPDPARRGDLGHLGGHLGRARARVLDREEAVGEAEEVVDRARRGHGRDGGGVGVPVRRDAQDGAGPGEGGPERRPRVACSGCAPARSWGSRGPRRRREAGCPPPFPRYVPSTVPPLVPGPPARARRPGCRDPLRRRPPAPRSPRRRSTVPSTAPSSSGR